MRKFWKILLYSAITCSAIFLFCLALDWQRRMNYSSKQQKMKADQEALFEKQKTSILWNGYAENSFSVKIISYGKKGNTYLVGEEILPNLNWAKLVLQPTIGSLPTLLYMDDSSGQVKRVICSAAEIL